MSEESRQNAIREIAYEKWELAGRPCGDGVNFWLEAEVDFDRRTSVDESPELAHSSGKARKSSIPPAPLKLAKIAAESRKKVG